MLKVGDVLFRIGDFNHTTIITDPMEFGHLDQLAKAQKMEIVHAASIDSGVYRELIDIDKEEGLKRHFLVYRANNAELADYATRFAKVWAWHRDENLKITKGGSRVKQTFYSYSKGANTTPSDGRYYGAQEMRKAAVNPEFGFDALFRAFKWACKLREAFSKERGTTCCAYITASFQAAVIDRLAKGDTKLILKAFEFLKSERAEKPVPKAERATATVTVGTSTVVTKRSLRAFSNAGAKDSSVSVDEWCKLATAIVCGEAKTVAEVFPKALIVDARFNYTDNLRTMMSQIGSGFYKVV